MLPAGRRTASSVSFPAPPLGSALGPQPCAFISFRRVETDSISMLMASESIIENCLHRSVAPLS